MPIPNVVRANPSADSAFCLSDFDRDDLLLIVWRSLQIVYALLTTGSPRKGRHGLTAYSHTHFIWPKNTCGIHDKTCALTTLRPPRF